MSFAEIADVSDEMSTGSARESLVDGVGVVEPKAVVNVLKWFKDCADGNAWEEVGRWVYVDGWCAGGYRDANVS